MIIALIQTQTSLSHAATWAWLGSVDSGELVQAIVTCLNLMGVIESMRFRGVRTTWGKLLRGQKQKERVREKGRRGLLSLTLRASAAASFHCSDTAAWLWIDRAAGKHCCATVYATNIAALCSANANKQAKRVCWERKTGKKRWKMWRDS